MKYYSIVAISLFCFLSINAYSEVTNLECDILTPPFEGHIIKVKNSDLEIYKGHKMTRKHTNVCKAEETLIICSWHRTRSVTIDTNTMTGELKIARKRPATLSCI